MKKFILGGVVIVLLGGYALWSASRSQTPTSVTEPTQQPSDSTNVSQPGSTPASSTSSAYKDGTYTGSVGDAAPYGQVQVSVVITGGKIAAVNMLQSPSGPGHTNELTASTFPVLIQEAIAAQSSKVNIVSGATQDSQGFEQSLTSALVQAQA